MTKHAGGNMSDPLYAFPTVCAQTLRALARYPDRVAFSWPGGSLTYAGTTELIGRIQQVFMQLGLEPGARVAPTAGALPSPRNRRGCR
jgi:fatty-acyl-CoA synthase